MARPRQECLLQRAEVTSGIVHVRASARSRKYRGDRTPLSTEVPIDRARRRTLDFRVAPGDARIGFKICDPRIPVRVRDSPYFADLVLRLHHRLARFAGE